MRIHRSLVALFGVAALAACGDKAERFIDAPLPTSSAIRFFNFGVNAPAVQFFANEQKVTAATSATCQAAKNPPVTATDTLCLTIGSQSTGGVGYGGVGAGGLYTSLDAGQYTFTGRTMTSAGPSVVESSVPATIASGKYYSYYQSGFYNSTTKTTDAFIVEDDLPATIDWTKVQVRFVNAIGNSQPMTLYAVSTEATPTTTALGSAAAYKSASAFTPLTPGVYNLEARTANGSVAIARENVNFMAGHVYTITARGDMTVTSSTDAKRPFLDNTANQ
jgi:hypothetical protein